MQRFLSFHFLRVNFQGWLLHRGLQGLSTVLPTHIGENLFSIVLQSRAFIGALPQLFPFPRRHIVCATSFLSFGNKKVQICLQKGRSIMCGMIFLAGMVGFAYKFSSKKDNNLEYMFHGERTSIKHEVL